MIRWVWNLRMAYLNKANIISIHDNIVTWRKMFKTLRNDTHPKDISTSNMSTIWLAVLAESSTSFNASSSLQVAAKLSPATSKSARGIVTLECPESDSPTTACSQGWSPKIGSAGCLTSEARERWKRTRPGRRKPPHYPPFLLWH
jgi:hypothetical protein